jgi:hypothetical protein
MYTVRDRRSKLCKNQSNTITCLESKVRLLYFLRIKRVAPLIQIQNLTILDFQEDSRERKWDLNISWISKKEIMSNCRQLGKFLICNKFVVCTYVIISNKKNFAFGLYCRALHPAQEHFRIKSPTPQVRLSLIRI